MICIPNNYYIVSALTWLIRFIYYWNLQFLINVIIIKTKVLFHRAHVTLADFGYPAPPPPPPPPHTHTHTPLFCLLPQTIKLFDLPIFWWLFQKRVMCTNFDTYVSNHYFKAFYMWSVINSHYWLFIPVYLW